ncbi:MAG: serine/threonine-protein kinase, partial [Chloroflexota bacterium]
MSKNTEKMLGRTIGQYKITEYIASGGMADVYKACDEGLGRDVAMKILFPQHSRDDEFIQRFQREARSAAILRHPNIVQIYSTGETKDGDHYIAMEYVPDGTLESVNRDLVSQGKLIETGRVIVVMRQIADALREAHERGIVHRDLKPSNILLRGNNIPVLTDLGIALSGNDPRLTMTNKMMGTPDYMSPEQAQGTEVDGRSDIYSFGIMLYELLCGRRPFGDESPWMIVHKQIHDDPKDLEVIRPGLVPQLYEIVNRCMAKKPELRYQTATELVQALDGAIVAHGESTGDSGEWQTVTFDAAGVLPPTKGSNPELAYNSNRYPSMSSINNTGINTLTPPS